MKKVSPKGLDRRQIRGLRRRLRNAVGRLENVEGKYWAHEYLDWRRKVFVVHFLIVNGKMKSFKQDKLFK